MRVLLVLLKRANKSMRCWPGHDYLLRYLPQFNAPNLRRALRELVCLGVVKVEHVHDERTGAQRKNIYTITLPTVKKIGEMGRRKTYARGVVKDGGGRLSKTNAGRAPYEVQHLKEVAFKPDLKDQRRTPLGSFDPRKAKAEEKGEPAWMRKLTDSLTARRLLDHFRALYLAKTGKPMVEFPRHLAIMDSIARAVGLPAGKAVCDLWFGKGSWSKFAMERNYKLAGGMERSIEDMQFSTRYPHLKARYERE